ncbi:MAG TPA: TIGR02186 family protein [Dongiaceae bacterium]|jgi:uncharacterized protein (TIGR02186 family)|nr:TIGR02186 family protein [Dongiaceae bacterium]
MRLLSFFLAGLFWCASASAQPVTVDLGQHLIAVTTRFSGANILLFGAYQSPADVIAVISGPRTDAIVRQKERILGVWVTAGENRIDNLPAYYTVATSTSPLSVLLPEDVLTRYHLGIDRLVGDIPASPYLDGFVHLKKISQLYSEQERAIRLTGNHLFRFDIALPTNVPTGVYTVDVYAVVNRRIVSHQSSPLLVNREGFDAALFDFAQRRSAMYGALSIAGALLGGWIAYMLFRRR